MTRRKSRKKQVTKKAERKGQCNNSPDTMASSWVDRLRFDPIDGCSNDHSDSSGLCLSVISWNVLAESYCSRKSHPGLPRQYQEVVFDPNRRGSLIRKILQGETLRDGNSIADGEAKIQPLMPDIWALQEVDMDEILSKHLSSLGYQGIETPRMKMGCGAGGKVDSCGIYFQKERWKLLDDELVRLDDLASLAASSDGDHKEEGAISSINNNLRGLQQTFLRRNVGLVVRLQSVTCPERTIVVGNVHLFWNPLYEYVKLCQIHYFMIRAKKFLKGDDEPFLLCGDLNSLPGNSVHTYLRKGVVNARPVAPWYRCGTPEADDTTDTSEENPEDDAAADGVDDVSQELANMNLTHLSCNGGNNLPEAAKLKEQQVHYLLDYNLNRLCRWFRILGLDAALETEDGTY